MPANYVTNVEDLTFTAEETTDRVIVQGHFRGMTFWTDRAHHEWFDDSPEWEVRGSVLRCLKEKLEAWDGAGNPHLMGALRALKEVRKQNGLLLVRIRGPLVDYLRDGWEVTEPWLS